MAVMNCWPESSKPVSTELPDCGIEAVPNWPSVFEPAPCPQLPWYATVAQSPAAMAWGNPQYPAWGVVAPVAVRFRNWPQLLSPQQYICESVAAQTCALPAAIW